MNRLITGLVLVLLLPVSACAAFGQGAPSSDTPAINASLEPNQTSSNELPSGAKTRAAGEATPKPLTVVQTPFPWVGLGVSGSIAFLAYDLNASSPVPFIVHLKLNDGHVVVDWRPPDNAWLANMALSPDGSQLVIAYAPPPADNSPQTGYTGLYLLPGSCLSQGCPDAVPQPLLAQEENGSVITPVWSPDGKYIYFAHVVTSPGEFGGQYDLQRLAASGGQPETLVEKAIWPRVSPDGSTLAYVAYDPPNGVNDLYLAAPDGAQAHSLLPPGTFSSMDAPIFSPDSQKIYFSATGPGPQGSLEPQPELGWWDHLTGVVVAEANGAPSEWWRTSVSGGSPERLTEIATAGLSGGFSPDGRWLAFVSYRGLGLYGLADGQVTWLAGLTTLGDVIWRSGD
ncbi:MAG: hypothetical protein WBZ24_12325 [Anaerolineales bacterium]